MKSKQQTEFEGYARGVEAKLKEMKELIKPKRREVTKFDVVRRKINLSFKLLQRIKSGDTLSKSWEGPYCHNFRCFCNAHSYRRLNRRDQFSSESNLLQHLVYWIYSSGNTSECLDNETHKITRAIRLNLKRILEITLKNKICELENRFNELLKEPTEQESGKGLSVPPVLTAPVSSTEGAA